MSRGALKDKKRARQLEAREERRCIGLGAQTQAGAIWTEAGQLVRELAIPGASLIELDEAVELLVRQRGGVPTNKGYSHTGRPHDIPYPAATCFMPNDMITHGIPTDRPLVDGDLLTFDMGVTVDGMHVDAAITIPIGEISEEAERLTLVCYLALRAGIVQAVPGARTGDISRAIEKVIRPSKFGIVKELCGHGINRRYHDEPQILNFFHESGPKLKLGQTIAIEPIITAGSPEIRTGEDGWSIFTADGSLAAQFEHTIVVANPPVILTGH